MSDAARQLDADDTHGALVRLRGIQAETRVPYDGGLVADRFTLRAGELAVVELGWDSRNGPLTDIVGGVYDAEQGEAFFDGLLWRTASPDDVMRARSRIGRVFSGSTIHWLSNLDLDENISLPFRHHHGPLTEEVRARLEALANKAGCWPLPHSRPAITQANILRRAEWVRAFLGNPDLLILERPLYEIGGSTEGLTQMVADALKRGAAILLVAREGDPWQSLASQTVTRWNVREGQLVEMN